MLDIETQPERYHLKGGVKKSVTETVRSWREYGPFVIPLPHPSWRNNGWLRKNPWFETELIPHLRARVAQALSCEH
jgi:uracil-DNA glycosylase